MGLVTRLYYQSSFMCGWRLSGLAKDGTSAGMAMARYEMDVACPLQTQVSSKAVKGFKCFRLAALHINLYFVVTMEVRWLGK
jgi:hypothetical protein